MGRIASYYCVLSWTFLAVASIFAISSMFMDAVLYPKWIITAILGIAFAILSLPLFFLSKRFSWRLVYKQVCRLTTIIVFGEAAIAISQQMGYIFVFPNCHAGTFNNLAGLAACLAISYPMGFMFFKEYNRYEQLFFCFCKLLCFVALVLYGSRIGCVCMFVTIFLVSHRNGRYRKLIAVILGSVTLLICACFLKTQSTFGRWFIIERTIDMIMKRPILGWGAGGFTREYMNIQADYFCHHPESSYTMLADNIHHPLNEFLLLATNYGIPFTMIVIICCFMVFLYSISHKSPYSKEGCLIFMNTLILASFSYPFTYPFTLLLIILSVVLILSDKIQLFKNRVLITTMVLLIGGISIGAYIPIKKELDFQLSWKRASLLDQKDYIDSNQMKRYERLYEQGQKNYNFLYDYACKAYDEERYVLALRLSKETERFIADYELKMLIGDCYQSLDSLEHAIQAYQEAQCMCPSRLMPLYETYSIYSSINDTVQCINLYSQIMHKDIKVRNQITEMILLEVDKDIKRFISH